MKIIHIIYLLIWLLLSGCTVSIDPDNEEDSWLVRNTEHFNFFYGEYEVFLMPSWITLDIDVIAERQEKGYNEILAALNVEYDGVINFYIYPPEYDDNHPVESGYADPTFETVYLKFHGRAFGRHEISHVISEQTIGRASIRLLNEGLAETLEYYQNIPLDEIHETISWTIETYGAEGESYLDILLRKGDNIPTNPFYLQAGLLVRYLVGLYGIERFKQLYTVDLSDFESRLSSLYGFTQTELESRFLDYLHYVPEYQRD